MSTRQDAFLARLGAVDIGVTQVDGTVACRAEPAKAIHARANRSTMV